MRNHKLRSSKEQEREDVFSCYNCLELVPVIEAVDELVDVGVIKDVRQLAVCLG